MICYPASELRIAVFAILLCSVVPGILRAGGREDIDELLRLLPQCNKQLKEKDYDAAEQTARQMRAICDRSFQDKPKIVAIAVDKQARVAKEKRQYAVAEDLYKWVLLVTEREEGAEGKGLAPVLDNLARLYSAQSRYADAEPMQRRSLAIEEKVNGPDHKNVANSLTSLAGTYLKMKRYAEAEPLYKRALAIREKLFGDRDGSVGSTLQDLGSLYKDQRRYAEAETFCRRALVIKEKAFGPEHRDVALSLDNLAEICHYQNRDAEAKQLYNRALSIEEQVLKPDELDSLIMSLSLRQLTTIEGSQFHWSEAVSLAKRDVAIHERSVGHNDSDLAMSLIILGANEVVLARYEEAESVYKRALAIMDKTREPDQKILASCLVSLSELYTMQGRYAEAEPPAKRALSICEKTVGPNDTLTAKALGSLASIYSNQNRNSDAEPLLRRVLTIQEKAWGSDNPNHLAWWNPVASTLTALTDCYTRQGRYAEAEPLAKRALAIDERAQGPDYLGTAEFPYCLASLYEEQKRYAEAEPLYKRALTITEKQFGSDHPDFALYQCKLAKLYHAQGRYAEAEPLADQPIEILERKRVYPRELVECLTLRARLGWRAKHPDEALADLRRGMELAEQIRGQGSGGERERASLFAKYADVFEQMVDWQMRLGNTNEVFAAIERARARSLLDELNQAGANLNLGRSAMEREALVQQEGELKSAVAGLEQQISVDKDKSHHETLDAKLTEARDLLYQFYRDQRSSSPVYRNLIAVGSATVRLSQVQRQLADKDTLILIYLLGEKGSYVLVLGGEKPHVEALAATAETAKILQIEAGPCTAARFKQMLCDEKTGLLQQLSGKRDTGIAVPRLAALWQLLIPAADRTAITGGKLKHLIVLPDGPLSLLPFETLVVETGAKPKYLLDAGPPLLYGPSATVLYNLSRHAVNAETTAVLTLGDPDYDSQPGNTQVARAEPLAELTAQSRYGAAGGTLARIANSGNESQWVKSAFQASGRRVVQISGTLATKASVLENAPHCRVIHLACHGLADASYGNFFGALALAPGVKTDDGFLTSQEICQMNLTGCELAILSACQTNYGPAQQGEGVWALSRSFLVAGARRVVASNWLVDDEAAATLIYYFCHNLVEDEKAGKPLDYARALHEAKRAVRNDTDHPKWSSPYYWGTFVLVGPS